MTGTPLLQVQDLVVEYYSPRGIVRAVDHVSFDINEGEIVGLAGESGCGKSTAANAILQILRPPARLAGGRVLFKGEDMASMPSRQLRKFRWRHVSMVFQSAMNALNPVLRVGDQFVDMIQAHESVSKKDALKRSGELLDMVGIDPARISAYPHELSGGMRQRVIIAMAMALRPELIVMDEPTTALDVVVQREILQEIEDLQRTLQFAVLFITHDLSLLVEFSNRIGIMYAGEIVEMAASDELFRHPKHPYTEGLMNSFPSLTGPKTALMGIPGSPPDLAHPPSACRFHPRCFKARPICSEVAPALEEKRPNHWAACHFANVPGVTHPERIEELEPEQAQPMVNPTGQ